MVSLHGALSKGQTAPLLLCIKPVWKDIPCTHVVPTSAVDCDSLALHLDSVSTQSMYACAVHVCGTLYAQTCAFTASTVCMRSKAAQKFWNGSGGELLYLAELHGLAFLWAALPVGL